MLSTRFVPERLGFGSPRITAVGFFVLVVDILTFIVLVWVQYSNGRWFMSFANYMATDGTDASYIKYSRVLGIMISDPLKEEFIFRGCIFYLLYRR